LEDLIESLFENPTMIPGTGMAEAPVIGTQYIVALDHSVLLPTIVAAMITKEKFRQRYHPKWPDLPVTQREIAAMVDDDCRWINLLGLFGRSQAGEYWDQRHPDLAAFASGLMFDRRTPARIRHNCGFGGNLLAGIQIGETIRVCPERSCWIA
jgi:hypothetical protein